jgi:hypothetical protein
MFLFHDKTVTSQYFNYLDANYSIEKKQVVYFFSQFSTGVSLAIFILVVVGATANFLAISLVKHEDTWPILLAILISDRSCCPASRKTLPGQVATILEGQEWKTPSYPVIRLGGKFGLLNIY